MWEFYLAGAEPASATRTMMVFQLQLTKDQKALPLTRDYINTSEHDFRAQMPVSRSRRAAPGAERAWSARC